LLGTAPSCEVELVLPLESGVVPRPGVTGPGGNICGFGASGICGFGPSGICCCCAALCCACSCAGCPSPGCPSNVHTKAPANTLLLTTRNPPYLFSHIDQGYQLPDYQRHRYPVLQSPHANSRCSPSSWTCPLPPMLRPLYSPAPHFSLNSAPTLSSNPVCALFASPSSSPSHSV